MTPPIATTRPNAPPAPGQSNLGALARPWGVLALALALAFTLGGVVGPADAAHRASKASAPVATWGGTVARIVDGDTLRIARDGAPKSAKPVAVRLRGIDCPESKANKRCKRLHGDGCRATLPAGKRAKVRAATLAPPGARVTVADYGPDRYRRTLGDVALTDGRDLGAILQGEGLCDPWRGK